MVRLLVQLERIDPLVVAIRFPLTNIVEVDFPKVNLSRVGSTCQESSLVDRKRVNVLIPGPEAELLWPQFNHENLLILALILLLGVCFMAINDLPLPGFPLNLTDGLH